MPPHYSPRSFFRQAPTDLLDRYFESRGLSFKPDVRDRRGYPARIRCMQLGFNFPKSSATRWSATFGRSSG